MRQVKHRVAMALAAGGFAAAMACAQDYPVKPVRLYVGFVSGSGTDTAARLPAQRLDEQLRQPVVVENRPGAGGNLAAEFVKKEVEQNIELARNAGIRKQ
jgi:tripartite-type tricarboxylate transporter receptor subunit TctC